MEKIEEKIFQSMLDASLHGVMLLQPVYTNGAIDDFAVAESNAAIKNQVGFSIAESGKRLLSEVFPFYKQYGFFDTYVATLATGQAQRRQLFYEDAQLQGWFDLGTAPLEDAVVVTFVNISDSKQYQQNIERSAMQLHAIMDIAQSGIFMFSPQRSADGEIEDFYFTMANRALASYVGQQPEVLKGALGSTWFPGYKTNGLFDLYKDTYITGRTNRFDFHYDDDGIDVWLDIMSTKLGDEVLVTFTDFTPTKQLQLKLEESVHNLKRSNENLEEFAYAASHDLQEPLRKIHFFSDRLKAKYENVLGKEGTEMLVRMEASTQRMRTLIDDLLQFSRVSAQQAHWEEINLSGIIHEVLIDLEASLQEKRGVVSVEALPHITGDARQLRQMFQNLISNSLKYSHPDRFPHVSITARKVKGKDSGLAVPLVDQGRTFHLVQVTDNGLGFEPAHAHRIFQIFQRLHGRTEYPGTGVGLAIVHKVVDNHRGYISAEGRPDEGATFSVLFPA